MDSYDRRRNCKRYLFDDMIAWFLEMTLHLQYSMFPGFNLVLT